MNTVSARIRSLRLALGLSQSELALRVGYTDRSSIAKVEKGISNLTQSKIQMFADALATTPQYLLGLTDDSYDYNLDPDGRFDESNSDQYRALYDVYDGDNEAIWKAYCRASEVPDESKMPTAYDRSELSDPAKELLDIIQNCSEEQAVLLLRVVKAFLASSE